MNNPQTPQETELIRHALHQLALDLQTKADEANALQDWEKATELRNDASLCCKLRGEGFPVLPRGESLPSTG